VIDHLAHLRADADAVLAVLTMAEGSEPVAGCPGWSVRDLVEHLGGVHRWARDIVVTGRPGPEPAAEGDLAAWFAEGAAALIETLAGADPAAATWSFTTDRTVGFWRRRQALETVVHRWDAQSAVGEPEPIDAVLAADGIGEVAELMLPRQVAKERIPPLPGAVRIAASDLEASYVLGDGEPQATVTAAAEVLLLLLWHRVGPADPRLRIDGDAALADQVLRLALAP
jgi:uncharacterized protein (TIGR03083 family)